MFRGLDGWPARVWLMGWARLDRQRGELVAAYSYLWGRRRKNGAGLFLVMVNDVIRGNSSSGGSVWVLGKAFFPLIEVYP